MCVNREALTPYIPSWPIGNAHHQWTDYDWKIPHRCKIPTEIWTGRCWACRLCFPCSRYCWMSHKTAVAAWCICPIHYDDPHQKLSRWLLDISVFLEQDFTFMLKLLCKKEGQTFFKQIENYEGQTSPSIPSFNRLHRTFRKKSGVLKYNSTHFYNNPINQMTLAPHILSGDDQKCCGWSFTPHCSTVPQNMTCSLSLPNKAVRRRNQQQVARARPFT